jgi:hypothetical protein
MDRNLRKVDHPYRYQVNWHDYQIVNMVWDDDKYHNYDATFPPSGVSGKGEEDFLGDVVVSLLLREEGMLAMEK